MFYKQLGPCSLLKRGGTTNALLCVSEIFFFFSRGRRYFVSFRAPVPPPLCWSARLILVLNWRVPRSIVCGCACHALLSVRGGAFVFLSCYHAVVTLAHVYTRLLTKK